MWPHLDVCPFCPGGICANSRKSDSQEAAVTFGQHASNAGSCELRPQAMSLLKAGSLGPHGGKERVEVACSPNTLLPCIASV